MASDGRTPPLHTARSVERTPPCCSAERQSCRRDASRHHTQRTQQAGENARTRCRVMSDVSPSLSTFALSLPHTLALRPSHLSLAGSRLRGTAREGGGGEGVDGPSGDIATSALLRGGCSQHTHPPQPSPHHTPLSPSHPPSSALPLTCSLV